MSRVISVSILATVMTLLTSSLGCDNGHNNIQPPSDVVPWDGSAPDSTIDVREPSFECTAEAPGVIQPLWIAGESGARSELGKFGTPDAIFIDDNGILLAGDKHQDYEEVHLFDVRSDDPNALADFLEPLADWGANPGPGGNGPLEFRTVTGFAQDGKSKRLYIVDQTNERIQIVQPTADPRAAPYYEFAQFFGIPAGDKSNPADGEFVKPQAANTDSLGRLFLTDEGRSDVQIFDSDLKYVGKFGDASYGPPGRDGSLVKPENIAIDEARNRIYVCDEAPDARVVVYRYSDLDFIQEFSGFTGLPKGIAVDQYGFLYVVDEGVPGGGGSGVKVFDPDTFQEVYRFGESSSEDDLTPGKFQAPDTLLIRPEMDLLVVADPGHDRIQGFRLSEIQARSCLSGMRVTSPSRAIAGNTLTLRAELFRPDGKWERESFRVKAQVRATTPDGSTVTISPAEFTIHNGVGTVTVTLNDPGFVDVTLSVGGRSGTRRVEILESPPERALTGVLSGDALSWGPDDGIIHIGGTAEVPAGSTLTIEAGTLIMLDPLAEIRASGGIVAEGTDDEPIYFFSADPTRGWGQLIHLGEGVDYAYENVFWIGGGQLDVEWDYYLWRHSSIPLLYAERGLLTMNRCVMADTQAKALLVASGEATIRESSFSRMAMGLEFEALKVQITDTHVVDLHSGDDSDGVYFWRVGECCTVPTATCPTDCSAKPFPASEVVVERLVLADGDDDGVDTQMGYLNVGPNVHPDSPIIRDSIVYGWGDKGMSLSAGNPYLENLLVFGNGNYGVKIDDHSKEPTVNVRLINSTVVGNQAPGFYVGWQGSDHIQPILDGVVMWDNAGGSIGTTFNPKSITVFRSIIPGAVEINDGGDNSVVDPLFIAPERFEFRMNPLSPAMTAGENGAPIGWQGF